MPLTAPVDPGKIRKIGEAALRGGLADIAFAGGQQTLGVGTAAVLQILRHRHVGGGAEGVADIGFAEAERLTDGIGGQILPEMLIYIGNNLPSELGALAMGGKLPRVGLFGKLLRQPGEEGKNMQTEGGFGIRMLQIVLLLLQPLQLLPEPRGGQRGTKENTRGGDVHPFRGGLVNNQTQILTAARGTLPGMQLPGVDHKGLSRRKRADLPVKLCPHFTAQKTQNFHILMPVQLKELPLRQAEPSQGKGCLGVAFVVLFVKRHTGSLLCPQNFAGRIGCAFS